MNVKSFKSAAIAAGILMSMLSSGCGSSANTQTVSADGSTSMEKVIGCLSEAYSEENPNVRISFNPTGSGSGIQAVLDGRCDIGLSSRELTDEESLQLDCEVVAVDGIALVVNCENPVSDLTVEEIYDIFTGKITSWEQVGGSSLPIVCIGREAASGTRDGFETVTNTRDLCVYSQELTSTGDIIQTVASNPNAVGYASVASLSDKVRVLSVDGVFPTEESVLDGSYKIRRSFLFVTQKGKQLSKAAQDFFDYALSGNAEELIRKAGAFPPQKQRETS